MPIEEIVISAAGYGLVGNRLSKPRKGDIDLEETSRFRVHGFRYELFDRHFLHVSRTSRWGGKREYELDLGMLDPAPKRSLKISWATLTVGGIPAAVAGYQGIHGGGSNDLYWLLTGGALSLVTLVLAFCLSGARLVFYSNNGRMPLVSFRNVSADPTAFRKFVKTLSGRAREANHNLQLVNRNELLNSELQEHRRLMEEGVISRKSYVCAKSRILARHR
jgi:hypothetical protein